ncbi:geranylgeranyl pyrophosphate synthase [Sphaeroforma arctica JP610]|uniref:Geranylgeranyl pyrophosphate synthase n=1 Tax=Sphaeroforma arctica JP610 TaxID=667725 RepID=A0A0L0FXB4_9EUKA|nr:geranylgeranyl pyrophosphate synthase [Sphaeroforma arctica JP610]KNC81191.1 geranylgeranyl pyrophosphate synthase [Sphaeroforma arctica JP610]|eukprot:XP_014155093.1 geranylgeranyl pyrophosphate synthase [Sphaeroforma arctica JP610]
MAIILDVVNMLHTSSLLADDIEDNSNLRRGIPVAHIIYGVPATINSANYVYFQALERITEMDNMEALQIFSKEMLELHRGQGKDIYWRDSNKCPQFDDYNEMVIQKTGGLFRLSVKLMQVFSQDQRDYVPLLNTMGLYFQIRDDYVNLTSTEYMSNKSFCEDLTEGKFSYPIVHSVLKNPNERQLLNILKQRTESRDVKKYALQLIHKSGSFEYTKRELDRLADLALEMIDGLGGNSALEELIMTLRHVHLHRMDSESFSV